MKAYQEFFDDAFRTYQKELEEKAESLSTWNLDNALTTLVSKHHANTVVLRQWEPSIGIETLPDVAAVVDAARTKVIDLKTKVHAELEKKRKDPTTEADISPLDSLASELASLQFSVEAYNQAVAAFTEREKRMFRIWPSQISNQSGRLSKRNARWRSVSAQSGNSGRATIRFV